MDAFDPARVAWVFDHDDLNHLLEAVATATDVVFDLETTGLDEHAVTGGTSNGGVAARVVLASYTLPTGDGEPTTWLLPLSHPDSPFLGQWREVLTRTCEAMAAASGLLVGHHVKFDCRWLHAMTGVDLAHRIGWDTQVSSHLLDETRSTKLKERAPATFGVERWDDFDLTYPGAAEDVPLFDLGRYAALDTYWTWRLFDRHRWEIHPDPDEVFTPEDVEAARLGQLSTYCSTPTVRTLATIEQNGFGLDTTWVQDQLRDHTKMAGELIDSLAALYPVEGKPSFAPTSKWFQQWTNAAVDQGDLRIASLTPTGKPQWSKAVLVRQARGGSDVAQSLLDLRDHTKKAEFLTSWLAKVSVEDRIHSTYNIGSVSSGRLSSSSPNLQQVTKALRPAFVPSPGHVVIDLDYSQIELRVAAFIARCEPMIKAYRQGRDLHMIMGGTTSGKAVRGASLSLMHLGLPANGTGAEVLQRVRSEAGIPEYEEVLIQLACEVGSDQDAGSRERWSAARGGEHAVEGRSLASAVSALPQGLVRALRSDYERFGWPWEWDLDDARRASSGLGPFQQRPIELDHALQVVSSLSAQQLKGYTDDPWSDYRQWGKAGNFGLIYGMGVLGFMEYAEIVYGVSFTEEEAMIIHETFFQTWEGIRQWHQDTIARLHREGQVVSPIGRVRRLAGVWDGNDYLVGQAERAGINSPVQGFASDLMQMAGASIAGHLPGHDQVPGASLVATVHDSIVVEAPADCWQEVAGECKKRMELITGYVQDHFHVEVDVPLVAEATAGSRWGLSDVGTV